MNEEYERLSKELKDKEFECSQIKAKRYELMKHSNLSEDAKKIEEILTSESNGWSIKNIYDVEDDYRIGNITVTLKSDCGFSGAEEIYKKLGYSIISFSSNPTEFELKKLKVLH